MRSMPSQIWLYAKVFWGATFTTFILAYIFQRHHSGILRPCPADSVTAFDVLKPALYLSLLRLSLLFLAGWATNVFGGSQFR